MDRGGDFQGGWAEEDRAHLELDLIGLAGFGGEGLIDRDVVWIGRWAMEILAESDLGVFGGREDGDGLTARNLLSAGCL
jgi:hypothetical protein